ncbi:SpoIIE family protein phosphatase [Solidesulfovibrio sp.]|uniref:SpoIIE family protein phosphatase n=1 Tax=Solidesulfovibrio sp. TaxID=2910990 RepID=UPI000EBB840D|nr:SpoIIE family protein phosphatase [Solidesulfovibrio sp.]MEA5089820.1 SpoIIE family protein phosphatase [Solidesulfovibrio sp.]HCR14572.1 serine/threonine protein phosphatase [Desulfovibrio sp.]HML61463.1 SpoIIE family protein phosphatase [Solidesulfovibrio sp.]
MTSEEVFVEVEAAQRNRYGEDICGDAFKTLRLPDEGRTIAVLSDGLGHGVKASILSLMTATMALKYTASDTDIVRAAEVIMDALPVCQVRKISYATFTVVDIHPNGGARVVEMDNPPITLVRDGQAVNLEFEEVSSPRYNDRVIRVYDMALRPGDRLIFTSDGITQAGLGSERLRLGWRIKGCREFALEQVAKDPKISARALSQKILAQGLRQEPFQRAFDDMTAAVIYLRRPRRTIILTGPPYAAGRDKEFAEALEDFQGRKIICGGTTANIVSRELGRPIRDCLTAKGASCDIPPAAEMEGVDLVTEGILTLTRTAQLLERDEVPREKNPATQLYEILLNSDSIEFVVGARINEAHQDPNLPIDLEIRRNIVKRIRTVLEEKYLKETRIRVF